MGAGGTPSTYSRITQKVIFKIMCMVVLTLRYNKKIESVISLDNSYMKEHINYPEFVIL